MRTPSIALISLMLFSACATPPAPPAPRTATAVTASFGKTWNAVVDVFADRNIPIANMDRTSGFIAAQPTTATKADTAYADCGKNAGIQLEPTNAVYNVLVRGDSSSSTVKMTIKFTRTAEVVKLIGSNDVETVECSTKGKLESQVEAQIKQRAEGA